MNVSNDDGTVEGLCRSGRIFDLLENYIALCNPPHEEYDGMAQKKTPTRLTQARARFPNLAGFCRFLKIGLEDFEKVSSSNPCAYGRIITALEDEALNFGASATMLSAYLKKRLKYEVLSRDSAEIPTELKISFEHDIFEDGE